MFWGLDIAFTSSCTDLCMKLVALVSSNDERIKLKALAVLFVVCNGVKYGSALKFVYFTLS